MALSITINVSGDAEIARITQRIAAGLAPDRLNPVLARAAVNHTRSHLFGLDNTRANKLGGRRTHFYAQAARGTQFQLASDGFIVGINQVGIRLRYFGGTVRPGKGISRATGKPTQYLTIPVSPQAYGRRAGEFADLLFRIVPGVGPALVKAQASLLAKGRGKKKGSLVAAGSQGGEVMYRLVRSASIKPDKTLLPTEAEYGAALRAEAETYIGRLAARLGGGN